MKEILLGLNQNDLGTFIVSYGQALSLGTYSSDGSESFEETLFSDESFMVGFNGKSIRMMMFENPKPLFSRLTNSIFLSKSGIEFAYADIQGYTLTNKAVLNLYLNEPLAGSQNLLSVKLVNLVDDKASRLEELFQSHSLKPKVKRKISICSQAIEVSYEGKGRNSHGSSSTEAETIPMIPVETSIVPNRNNESDSIEKPRNRPMTIAAAPKSP